MLRRRPALLSLPLLAGALTACGSPGVGDVQDTLAEEIRKEAAERNLPVRFDQAVSCPREQSLAPGQTFDCEVGALEGGSRFVYTIAVAMTGENRFTYRITERRAAATTAPRGG